MILRTSAAHGFIRTNAAFREIVGFDDSELAEQPLLHWIRREDQPLVRAMLDSRRNRCFALHRTRSGEYISLNLQKDDREKDGIVLGRSAVVPETPRAETEDGAATVRSTLETIARIVEEQNPGYKSSILLVADGRFVSGAGPSLPDEYNAAIDGHAVGATVGSCGTAIYWNVPVIVEDIQADPLWAPFAELASSAGVAACWSYPFTATSGRVLGAIALYAPESRAPTFEQILGLKAAARMTGLAVERARAEEALRAKQKTEAQLQEQLRNAAKMEAIGVLAGGVAHDFNNLLTSIISYASFVRDELPVADKRRDDVREVLSAAEKAAGLTRQLLLFSRQQPAEFMRVDVGSSLSAIERLLRRTIGEDIHLIVTPPENPVHIWADSTLLDQIILNLAINARDAMPQGGTLRISTTTAGAEYVCLEVVDTGVGMDASTQSRIFEPFFTTKEGTRGTGLGLATCYGAVKQLDGTIEVKSELEKGTTFSVRLPVYHGADPVPKRVSVTESHLRGDETILVIEDDRAIRQIAKRALGARGCSVLTAEDGVSGLELFDENRDVIDLVISDIVLPRGSGYEVAAEVKRRAPEVSVLLTTGYTELRDAESLESPIFWKPYTPAALARRIRQCLSER